MGSYEFLDRYDHGRETTLHIGGAASEQQSIANDRLERIAVPRLEIARRHYVGMSRKANEGRRLPASRPKIADVSERQRFATKAGRFQPRRDLSLATGVVRRHRTAANERLQQLDHGYRRISLFS
jgi:hypothetical protein